MTRENLGMRREYENQRDKCLQNNILMESGIWEYEKNKVRKWCIGGVWKNILHILIFPKYFHEESINHH